jgi:hypothetical protein
MAKRILPLRAGRSMRWTFEVLADVGAKSGARVKKTARKRRRAKPLVKKAPVPVASSVDPAPSVGPPSTVNPPAPLERATRLQAVIMVAAAVLVVAAVAFPRRPAAPGAAGSDGQQERREAGGDVASSTPSIAPAPVPRAALAAASTVVTPRAVAEPSKKSSVKPVTNRVAGSAKSVAPVAVAAAIADAPKNDDSATRPAAPEPLASPASVTTASVMPTLVTIVGCLEISTDGDTFRLNDVEGADAPKSRTWRSGFLKKRTAPVTLVEPPNRLTLTSNVGRRVAATGQLNSRDLKVSSLRVVGSSCN